MPDVVSQAKRNLAVGEIDTLRELASRSSSKSRETTSGGDVHR